MKRVTGIGGIFFKAKDPKALGAWYKLHLGIEIEEWGGAAFRWGGSSTENSTGSTIWNPFSEDTTYFSPGNANFMINYRVDDLHALLNTLRSEGVHVEQKTEESEYGKFGWIIDPEGNKVELWQPPVGQ